MYYFMYILNNNTDVYEEDPTKYSDAIQQFQDLRQSTHSIELDMNGE